MDSWNKGKPIAPKGWDVTSVEPRPICTIAREIAKTWPKPYFGAVPYLSAMQQLDTLANNYYEDTAQSVVLYFLSNATTWKGEDARRIKAELNAMIKAQRARK
jgi:hypothetical protein